MPTIMGRWIPVFRGGRQTNSRGEMKDWKESDVQKMVDTFDQKQR